MGENDSCGSDVSYFGLSYTRLFPIEPTEECEKGIKCLAVIYDVSGYEKGRMEVWAKLHENGKEWILTPIK